MQPGQLTDEDVDFLLEDFDRTEPALQRKIVAAFVAKVGIQRHLIAELTAELQEALPQLEWANIHGLRCQEQVDRVKDLIPRAQETANGCRIEVGGARK